MIGQIVGLSTSVLAQTGSCNIWRDEDEVP